MSAWPNADPEFHCACRFKRERDFGPTDLVEPCGYHAAREASAAVAIELLRRIRQWDMLDHSGDGPYWRGEIDAALAKNPNPSGLVIAEASSGLDRTLDDSEASGPVGLGSGVHSQGNAPSRCPMCGTAATFEIRLPEGERIPAASMQEAQRLLRTHQRQWPNEDLSIGVISVKESLPSEGASPLAGKPCCWIRLEHGRPDWAEDCVGHEKSHVLIGYDSPEYTALPLYAIPRGWRVVPEVPSEAMLDAVDEPAAVIHGWWDSMLTAALSEKHGIDRPECARTQGKGPPPGYSQPSEWMHFASEAIEHGEESAEGVVASVADALAAAFNGGLPAASDARQAGGNPTSDAEMFLRRMVHRKRKGQEPIKDDEWALIEQFAIRNASPLRNEVRRICRDCGGTQIINSNMGDFAEAPRPCPTCAPGAGANKESL